MINSSHHQLIFGMVFLTETHKPSRVTVYDRDAIVYLPPIVFFFKCRLAKDRKGTSGIKIRRSQENSEKTEKKERKRRQSQEKQSLVRVYLFP